MDQPLPSQDVVDVVRVARLVRPFETFEARAVRRPGGGWSIGYGHDSSAREGAEITQDEAEALLLYDLRRVASVVRSAIYAPIHRNQLEALIAFAFHIGTENFLHSTTLHRFNAGDSLGAAQEIERWCHAEIDGEAQVVDALVRRRAAEKAHFLTPPQGFPKASRARITPQFEAPTPPIGDEVDAAPSATLAAAHSVSARLRALVPDNRAERAELAPSTSPSEPTPAPYPESVDAVAAPRQTDLEPLAAPIVAAAAPVLFETVAPPEPEIPPPPMPFEAAPRTVQSDPARRSDPAGYDVWPSFTPGEVRADDPFAQGPLEATSIEAPLLDRAAPISSLFRSKPEHRVQIPPRPEQADEAPPPRAAGTGVPRLALWACIIAGLLIFIWAIWSIFTTNPGLVNFVAGLAGIAVMAVPAYLLLGAKSAAK